MGVVRLVNDPLPAIAELLENLEVLRTAAAPASNCG